MNKWQEERKSRSPFTEAGMQVALVRHNNYGDRIIDGPHEIYRVYKTGNFTVKPFQTQQWAPDTDGGRARQTGTHGYHSEYIVPWTPDVDREKAAYQEQTVLLGKLCQIKAQLNGLRRGDISREMVDALEAALCKRPQKTACFFPPIGG